MIAFTEEKFADAWPEFKVLAEAHWQETEMYRHGEGFNPQVEEYIRCNEAGVYRLYVAREGGRMVGNAGMYITPSMHTRKMIATEDTWFLVPEARKGRNAIRLYQFVENEMRKHGAVEISMTTKLTNGAGRILEYLDYKHVANHYSKGL